MSDTTSIFEFAFVGVSKKDQIVVRSFFNLIQTDLPWQVNENRELTEKGHVSRADITASDYESIRFLVAGADDPAWDMLASEVDVPAMVIGAGEDTSTRVYIEPPIQWSDFRAAIQSLTLAEGEDLLNHSAAFAEDQSLELSSASFFPRELELKIVEEEEFGAKDLIQIDGSMLAKRLHSYNFELDELSSVHHSYTNGDVVRVVDEVADRRLDAAGGVVDPIVLMTDDESTALNSVLILETNSAQAWDPSELEDEDQAYLDESAERAMANLSSKNGTTVLRDGGSDEEQKRWAELNTKPICL